VKGVRQIQRPIDERLLELAAMLRQPLTASQIAARMGLKKPRINVLLAAALARGLVVSGWFDGEVRYRAAPQSFSEIAAS
jgi:hypothetical protein